MNEEKSSELTTDMSEDTSSSLDNSAQYYKLNLKKRATTARRPATCYIPSSVKLEDLIYENLSIKQPQETRNNTEMKTTSSPAALRFAIPGLGPALPISQLKDVLKKRKGVSGDQPSASKAAEPKLSPQTNRSFVVKPRVTSCYTNSQSEINKTKNEILSVDEKPEFLRALKKTIGGEKPAPQHKLEIPSPSTATSKIQKTPFIAASTQTESKSTSTIVPSQPRATAFSSALSNASSKPEPSTSAVRSLAAQFKSVPPPDRSKDAPSLTSEASAVRSLAAQFKSASPPDGPKDTPSPASETSAVRSLAVQFKSASPPDRPKDTPSPASETSDASPSVKLSEKGYSVSKKTTTEENKATSKPAVSVALRKTSEKITFSTLSCSRELSVSDESLHTFRQAISSEAHDKQSSLSSSKPFSTVQKKAIVEEKPDKITLSSDQTKPSSSLNKNSFPFPHTLTPLTNKEKKTSSLRSSYRVKPGSVIRLVKTFEDSPEADASPIRSSSSKCLTTLKPDLLTIFAHDSSSSIKASPVKDDSSFTVGERRSMARNSSENPLLSASSPPSSFHKERSRSDHSISKLKKLFEETGSPTAALLSPAGVENSTKHQPATANKGDSSVFKNRVF